MTAENQSQFARRLGKDRAHVTRLKQAGRIVLTDNGLVDVEASLTRIEATRGKRHDVEDRWARERGESRPPNGSDGGNGGEAPTGKGRISTDEIGWRTRMATMHKEEAAARKQGMEADEIAGLLRRAEEIERVSLNAVGVILSVFDNLPDRLAPQLTDIADKERIRARLKDEMEGLRRIVAGEFKKLAKQEDRRG